MSDEERAEMAMPAFALAGVLALMAVGLVAIIARAAWRYFSA